MGMFVPIVAYFFITLMDIWKWIQINDQIKIIATTMAYV